MYELSDCMIHQTYTPLAAWQCEFGVAIVSSLPQEYKLAGCSTFKWAVSEILEVFVTVGEN